MKERPCHLDKRSDDLITKLRFDPRSEFSTPELATLLGVSISWLKNNRVQGQGPGFVRTDPPLPLRVYYTKAGVMAWLQSRREAWEAKQPPQRRAA